MLKQEGTGFPFRLPGAEWQPRYGAAVESFDTMVSPLGAVGLGVPESRQNCLPLWSGLNPPKRFVVDWVRGGLAVLVARSLLVTRTCCLMDQRFGLPKTKAERGKDSIAK